MVRGCVQVRDHAWVVGRGGKEKRQLGVEVLHGTAQVAAVRRLRYMVHCIIALQRLNKQASANRDLAAAADEKPTDVAPQSGAPPAVVPLLSLLAW